MTALIERHMLAGSVRRVVRSVTVVGSHGMPKGTPCRCDAAVDAMLATVTVGKLPPLMRDPSAWNLRRSHGSGWAVV